jgi:SCP-2 sterol transfer family
VSSSSSAADSPARRLLGAALDVLRREAPAHNDVLCGVIATLPISLHVDREVLGLRIAGRQLRIAAPDSAARVTVQTDLATAHALLDARLTVLEAVQQGKLDVRGNAADLCTAAEALSTFLHGLVRCPSGAALLCDLRVHASNER